MILSPPEWHTRFTQQARWTQNLRNYLYEHVNLHGARRVLEVGSGTGVIAGEVSTISHSSVYGLDINPLHLREAMRNAPEVSNVQGDAHQLPFPEGAFDLTLSHFLLLWVDDPLLVVQEMARVTRPGGAVLSLAEPDYGGRIDYPHELERLGKLQTTALHHQGADPFIGRKLRSVFTSAGLISIETGVLGGQWSGRVPVEDRELELRVLLSDLEHIPNQRDSKEIRRLLKLDRAFWERGERVLFVPTFYAWGRVPG